MTVIINAVQDGTDRKKVTLTARNLPGIVTVFQFGDGTQEVVNTPGGSGSSAAHVYPAGTFEVSVLSGSTAEHMTLPPVATGLVWAAASLTADPNPNDVPLGAKALASNVKSSSIVWDWNDGTVETLPVQYGLGQAVHRYRGPGLYDVKAETYTNQLSDPVTVGTINVATTVSLAPNTAATDAANFTLHVTGTGFVPGAQVSFDGSLLTTTYVSATEVTAPIVTAGSTAGAKPVGVKNPGVALSNTVSFTYTAP